MRAIARLTAGLLSMVLLAGFLVFSTAGCGNGGPAPVASGDESVGGPPLFTFSGDFRVVTSIVPGGGDHFAVFGLVTADAAGMATGTGRASSLGVVSPTPLPTDAEYFVLPDGTLEWGTFTGGIGAMSTDTNVAALYSVGNGMTVLLRRQGSFDLSSIAGTYRFVALLGATTGNILSLGGTLVFDGAGGATLTPEFLNNEGTHTAPDTETGTYTLTTQGDLTIDFGLLELTGGVDPTGEILTLGGGVTAGQDSLVLHAIREGAGRSAAQFNGTYAAAVYRVVPTTHDAAGRYGEMAADGAGGAMWTPLFPDLAAGAPFVTIPRTYTVAPNGQMDMDVDAEDYRGIISESGDVAFLVGGVTDGEDPGLLAFVRKRALPLGDELPVNAWQSAYIDADAPAGFVQTLIALDKRLEVGEEFLGRVFGATQGVRSVLRFELDGLRPGATVARAVLVTTQGEVEGDPFTNLGNLQVRHVSLGASISAADYNPAARPLGLLGVLSDNPIPGPRSLDVTAAVLADIADGRTTSDFLLAFPIEENGDRNVDRVTLDDHDADGPSAGPRTRLVITYE